MAVTVAYAVVREVTDGVQLMSELKTANGANMVSPGRETAVTAAKLVRSKRIGVDDVTGRKFGFSGADSASALYRCRWHTSPFVPKRSARSSAG